MTQRLIPPPGYASWIDYAVENMETRSLELEALFDGEKHWPQGTTREQMRQAVQAELTEIRQAIQQLQPSSEVASGTQLTVKQVIECLRRHPGEAVVLVEGYETGWDVIHAIRQAAVVKYRKVKDWDGEYQEANQFKQPGDYFLAVLIEGRRGHRRSLSRESCIAVTTIEASAAEKEVPPTQLEDTGKVAPEKGGLQ